VASTPDFPRLADAAEERRPLLAAMGAVAVLSENEAAPLAERSACVQPSEAFARSAPNEPASDVHGGRGRRRTASPDEIERPAQGGRSFPPGVESAIDFDPLRQFADRLARC